MKIKLLLALIAIFCAAFAAAGTLTVTSPTDGAFLGRTNTLRFQINGATLETTVRATIQGPVGSPREISGRFTPDNDGKINDSLSLSFAEGSPEGTYTITVTATEPGNTYNTVILSVTVDVTKPKFFDLNPLDNSFVKGPNVPIVVKVNESNFKEYRVQVDGQDIPGNTGTTLDANNTFTVIWEVGGIQNDGVHSISIKIKDEADNEETKTLNVTLDRVPPLVAIRFPRADTRIRPRTDVQVVVDVTDASGSSVPVTGVDVVIQNMQGQFLMRVPRLSFTNGRWTGRIRKNVTLPSQFKVVATAIDRAGNQGQPDTVTARIG